MAFSVVTLDSVAFLLPKMLHDSDNNALRIPTRGVYSASGHIFGTYFYGDGGPAKIDLIIVRVPSGANPNVDFEAITGNSLLPDTDFNPADFAVSASCDAFAANEGDIIQMRWQDNGGGAQVDTDWDSESLGTYTTGASLEVIWECSLGESSGVQPEVAP